MKKRHQLLLAASLLFTAASIYQVNHHPMVENIKHQLASYSDQIQEELVYVHLDRSFYRPGESIWLAAYIRNLNDKKTTASSGFLNIEIYHPNGSLLDSFEIICPNGQGSANIQLPAQKGGIYRLKAYTDWQKNADTFFEKEIQVQEVLLPNLNMKLEFEKKAYGVNDRVFADLTLEGLDNQAFGFASFNCKVQLSGEEFLDFSGKTDKDGKAKIEFNLPDTLKSNDGILNVMIPYRGLTESISRSIPIVLNAIDLAFFPEGGDLIKGHTSTIAFEALNEFGKPADISGFIEDENGKWIGTFSSLHNGMGKFSISAQGNKNYFAKITQPEGISKVYSLPKSLPKGTTLRLLDQQKDYIRISVQQSKKDRIHLIAQSGDSIYFARSFIPKRIEEMTISTSDFPIGITRLTVFNDQKVAQCERLIFLNKHKQLHIDITTDKKTYLPREKVELQLKVKDEDGKGIAGNFSLSVADDKLLSFADDKQGHILSKVFLERELKGEIHEPNFYFDKSEEKADLAMDLLMMTHGWRRFEWQSVFEEKEVYAAFSKKQLLLSGRVVNEEGYGIPNAMVTAVESKRQVRTNERGHFEFRDLVMRYKGDLLLVTHDQKIIGRQRVSTYNSDIKILVNKPTGHLSGKLFYKNGKPCKNCDFQISKLASNTKWKYTTDVEGAFSVLNVESGNYLISELDSSKKAIILDTISVISNQPDFRDLYFKKEKLTDKLASTDEQAKVKYDTIFSGHQPPISKIFQLDMEWNDKSEIINRQKEEDENLLLVDSRSLYNEGVQLNHIMVTGYKVPLIDQDNTTQGGTLTSEQIRKLPTKNIAGMAAITAGLSQLDEGDGLTVRGSRAGSIDYYIDGVRVRGSAALAGTQIDQIEIITSGIEAKYGGWEANIPASTERPDHKIPVKAHSKYRVDAPQNNPFDDENMIVSSMPGSNYSYGYISYWIPKKAYATPSDPAIYDPNCTACKEIESADKKLECHQSQLVEKIRQIGEDSYFNFENTKGESVNIQLILDRKGKLRDINVSPDHEDDHYISPKIYSLRYYLNNWLPARNNGRNASSVVNIRIKYSDFQATELVPYKRQRQFYGRSYHHNQKSKIRNDFRSTLYWNPAVQTDGNGEATLAFWNSDDITKFKITVEGFGNMGQVGRGEADYSIRPPFTMVSKIPASVATLDTMQIPVTLINNTNEVLSGNLKLKAPEFCQLLSKLEENYTLEANESKTLYLSFAIVEKTLTYYNRWMDISFETKEYYDAFRQSMELIVRGFPHHYTFTNTELVNEFDIRIENEYPGSIKANFKAHPDPISELSSAMEKIIRQPYGCFEQTSSSNYPNLMVLQLMNKKGISNHQIRSKAMNFLEKGYERLTGFECQEGGFSLYGNGAADPGLTAIGLMQFMDMSKVYPVDKRLIKRTAAWLMADIDSSGGWQGIGSSYYSKTTQRDAYILWAMSEAGYGAKLQKERDRQYDLFVKNKDPYLIALLCNSLMLVGDSRGLELIEMLIGLQKSNGGWAGAERSVSYSKGKNLVIESTALALLAVTKSEKKYPLVAESALNFLLKSRNQYGYGSTQSTVLTLKAIVAYLSAYPQKTIDDGTLEILVDGKVIKSFTYKKGQTDGMVLNNIPGLEKSGKHTFAVQFKEKNQIIPFEFEITYNSKWGQTSDRACQIALTTNWSRNHAKTGETIRLKTLVQNLSKDTVASPLAIIGIPGGLSAQPWQLKELIDKKVVEYYETSSDRIVFYLNHMQPEESKIINLDLKADIPGNYQSPASSAYLYYDNDAVSWAEMETIAIGQ